MLPAAEPTSPVWRVLVRELSAFGVVGAAAFVVDTVLFQLLYAAGTGAITAKLLAALAATTVAFVGHRNWSFAHRARTGLRRESLLFATVNGATMLLGAAVIGIVRYPLGQESAVVLQIANVCAIGAGTLVRFLAYRRWVFPARERSGTSPARLDETAGSAAV